MTNDQVKQRLRKLFAVADNDAASQGEIDNAMAIASSIMRANAITREDIEENDGEIRTDKVNYGRRFVYSRFTSLTAWENCLAFFVTEFVPGCGWYRTTGKYRKDAFGKRTGGKATLITFYGPDEDVQLCLEVWHEVVLFVTSAAQLRYGNALARGEAAAYAEGFGRGLYAANKRDLEKLEDQSKSDSNALIVVNRTLAIKEGGVDWLKEEHEIELQTGGKITSQRRKNRSAYAQGKQDGAGYKPGSKKRAGYLT